MTSERNEKPIATFEPDDSMAHVADPWRRHIQSLGRWLRCLLKAHDSLLLGISKPNDRLRIVDHIRFLVCAWNGGRPTRSVPRIAMEVGLVPWRQAPRARWHT